MPSTDDTRAVLEAAVLKELKARNDATRARVQGTLKPGDRRTVWLDDAEIGTVSRNRPSTGWAVTDREAFTAWVAETYPEAIVTTRSVVPAWEKELLASGVDKATGEVPPGLEEKTSTPGVVVKPNATGTARAVEMMLGGLPELGSADGDLDEWPPGVQFEDNYPGGTGD